MAAPSARPRPQAWLPAEQAYFTPGGKLDGDGLIVCMAFVCNALALPEASGDRIIDAAHSHGFWAAQTAGGSPEMRQASFALTKDALCALVGNRGQPLCPTEPLRTWNTMHVPAGDAQHGYLCDLGRAYRAMLLRIPGNLPVPGPAPGTPTLPPTADGWAAIAWKEPFYFACTATAAPGPSSWKLGPCPRQDVGCLSDVLRCIGSHPPEPALGRRAVSPFMDGFYISDAA